MPPTLPESEKPLVRRKWWATAGKVLGVEINEATALDRLIAAVGGAAAVALVAVISHNALGYDGAAMLIASVGASAVLLFAAPHAQVSQPWPVLAGNLVGATVGVTSAAVFTNLTVAAAVAIGFTIAGMHLFKCIHPPGGATALTAVIGGEAVSSMGYGFVWHPALLNALAVVVLAVLINGPFEWRRYHVWLAERTSPALPEDEGPDHDVIIDAMRQLESFVDISEADLRRLHNLLNDATEDP